MLCNDFIFGDNLIFDIFLLNIGVNFSSQDVCDFDAVMNTICFLGLAFF